MPILAQKQEDQYCAAKHFAVNRSKAVQFNVTRGVEQSKNLHQDVQILKGNAFASRNTGRPESELWAERTGHAKTLEMSKPTADEFMNKVLQHSSSGWANGCDSYRLCAGDLLDAVIKQIQSLVNINQLNVYKSARFETLVMPFKQSCMPPIIQESHRTMSVKITFSYYAYNEKHALGQSDMQLPMMVAESGILKAKYDKELTERFSFGDGIVRELPLKSNSDIQRVKSCLEVLPSIKTTTKSMVEPLVHPDRDVLTPEIIDQLKYTTSAPPIQLAKDDTASKKVVCSSSLPANDFERCIALPSNGSPHANEVIIDTKTLTAEETKKKIPNKKYESVHSLIAFHSIQSTEQERLLHGHKSDISFVSGADYWRRLQTDRHKLEESWHGHRQMLTDAHENIIFDADQQLHKQGHRGPHEFRSLPEFIKYTQKMHAVARHVELYGKKVSLQKGDDVQQRESTTSKYYTETLYGQFTGRSPTPPPASLHPDKSSTDDEPPLLRKIREKMNAQPIQPIDPKKLHPCASTDGVKKRVRMRHVMDGLPEPSQSRAMLISRLEHFINESYLPRLEQITAKTKPSRRLNPKRRRHSSKEPDPLESLLPPDILEKPVTNWKEGAEITERLKEWVINRVQELVVRKEQVTFSEGHWPTVTSITFSLPPLTIV